MEDVLGLADRVEDVGLSILITLARSATVHTIHTSTYAHAHTAAVDNSRRHLFHGWEIEIDRVWERIGNIRKTKGTRSVHDTWAGGNGDRSEVMYSGGAISCTSATAPETLTDSDVDLLLAGVPLERVRDT